ncbi:Zinc transporter ZIP6,Zinc transporter foi,Zinc transporter ZIP10 [Mytilus coruscus]|uniref:Zinc transporter ZIP6,Zinc transporter foi,Zinc transporter ZIP10 n=1 Tax=Mytilus coruscus TaxID=42192 RepID=A0A6J8AW17_MYTCO|nr:Zinc transporter ZIP6,Zinc transporter foi,Zinc transporter ZIP10 [Mytilus coruscus]
MDRVKCIKFFFPIFLTFVKFTVSHNHQNYYDGLIKKFSDDGKLSRSQFQKLVLDVTSQKLPPAFIVDCKDKTEDIDCLQNETIQCLGYDEIFNKYSNSNGMDQISLEAAVPALLYYTQDADCNIVPEPHSKHKKPTSAQAWGYGIGFVSLIVFVSNVGALLGPCMKSKLFKRILMFCVALAVGTLAATGLLVLIPESLGLTGEDSPVPDYNWKMTSVIGGIYFVFICERLLKMWFFRKRGKAENEEEQVIQLDPEKKMDQGHSHFDQEDMEKGHDGIASVAWILLVGDAIHNFVDGLSIGAAFTENVFTGISVSLAVICEELPHELGDIAILLHSGLSMKRALFYNFLAAVTCYGGLVIGIVVGESTDANMWIFGFAGGLFVYISLVAMIPEMNEQAALSKKNKTESATQVFLYQNAGLLIGFLIIILISYYGKYIDM